MDAMVERRFGRFIIQPGRRQLLIDGEPAKVGSRAFDLLMALVERRQRVVTKDELLDLVWPGIAVEEGNLQVHIFALRKLLGTDAIATIPGRGYQFTAALEPQPIAVPASAGLQPRGIAVDATAALPPKASSPRAAAFGLRRAAILIAAGLIAIAVAGGAWRLLAPKFITPIAFDLPAPSKAAHLSLVVLPFDNLSGDASQDYLADGIVENLTTDLSRIHNSFVITHSTANAFKAKSVDVGEIGRELHVRYVLEGSVQRDQNRVRVNAQLIDAQSGAHLWAERFDEDAADLFKLQDDVVARLANTLGFELANAEARRGERATNPDAVDLAMRGWALARPPRSIDANNAARALFEQAINLDPREAEALAGEAYTFVNEYIWARNPQTDYDAKILDQADRSIAAAPDSLWAYYAKCVYFYASHRASQARDAADAGLAVNPNFGPLLMVRGIAEIFLGRFESAKADMEQGMRLDPRDLLIGFARWYLAGAELGLRNLDAAIVDYRRSIADGYVTCLPYASLAAAYTLEGKAQNASTALMEARRLEPKLNLKWLIEEYPNIPALFDGLRKAGLREE